MFGVPCLADSDLWINVFGVTCLAFGSAGTSFGKWYEDAARGARVQRPLWASTSTKDPEYPDTLYVDELIGPHTVNTLPDNTLEAFKDHGTIARTIDSDVPEARAVIDALAALGIDMVEVTQQLEDEGVAAFEKSFDELLSALSEKAATLA